MGSNPASKEKIFATFAKESPTNNKNSKCKRNTTKYVEYFRLFGEFKLTSGEKILTHDRSSLWLKRKIIKEKVNKKKKR